MQKQLDGLHFQGNLFSPWKDNIQEQGSLPGFLEYIGA